MATAKRKQEQAEEMASDVDEDSSDASKTSHMASCDALDSIFHRDQTLPSWPMG